MSSLKELGMKDKYLVIKRDDMVELLENEPLLMAHVRTAIEKINRNRIKNGKKKNEYLVVNTDEPYAEEVANIIKKHESI